MTDIFAIETPTQRKIVTGALLLYVALFVTDLTTGNALAGTASDLLVAVLVMAACGVGLQRINRDGDPDAVAVATVAALGIAGLSIGYEGLSELGVVTAIPTVEAAGSFALLAALALYFYNQYA